MDREAMINRDAMNPKFIKYNPCYYCKKTATCASECMARTGFTNVLEEHLEHFYKTDADETAIEKMKLNAKEYGLPILPERTEPRLSPYERTRAAVYATGNKWAIENFEATH